MIASSVVVSGPHVGPRRQSPGSITEELWDTGAKSISTVCCDILVSINCDNICDCLTEQACA